MSRGAPLSGHRHAIEALPIAYWPRLLLRHHLQIARPEEGYLGFQGWDEDEALLQKRLMALPLLGIDYGDLSKPEYAGRSLQDIVGFDSGGIITEPTLLTRLSDMVPYGVMAERRPERITPDLGGGIVINIAEMNVRNNEDINRIAEKIVEEIRLRRGLRI